MSVLIIRYLILQEVSDLQEQLADLMRHLETQQAIASASDETRQVSKTLSLLADTVVSPLI